ncbi:hypothetical protein [Candidatus Odyssella acanthamoebae]|uniref:Uncharacterized protein n=1 Tax=Candidatus Odyssella acanthamoebae TaxID=91604 RepID=A0A077AUB2_9PROT|nr:hypothetical protein [Candidatus Paracaedibacter acanthamoebae]AIK95936.1 hypothetical protein ID47_03070 [Candidatus Paracaedibacter acanthamoebae]
MINEEIKSELQACSTGLEEVASAIFSRTPFNSENFLREKIVPKLNVSDIKNTTVFLDFICRIQNNSDSARGRWDRKFAEYKKYIEEEIGRLKKKFNDTP